MIVLWTQTYFVLPQGTELVLFILSLHEHNMLIVSYCDRCLLCFICFIKAFFKSFSCPKQQGPRVRIWYVFTYNFISRSKAVYIMPPVVDFDPPRWSSISINLWKLVHFLWLYLQDLYLSYLIESSGCFLQRLLNVCTRF